MIRRALVTFLVFSIAGGAGAATLAGATSPESPESLYRYSGLERQIPLVGSQIAQQLHSESNGIPATIRLKMAAVARRTFDPQRMKAEILADLRAKWNPTLAGEALKWLRSPIGRRVIQMEEAASTPEAQRAQEAFAASFAATPPDPKRVEWARQLDQATRATEISLGIMSTMARAIVRGAAAAHPGPASLQDLESELDAQRPSMKRTAEAYSLIGILYAYRELSPEHFREYLAFFDSPAGQWYQQFVGAAYQRSMEKASEKFAAELVRILPFE